MFTNLGSSIHLVSRFDRSTSLELDFKDPKKLGQVFISEKFEAGLLEVLETVISQNCNQRVRVLSGSPGLGKSTFALVLLNLLEKTQPKLLRELVGAAKTPNKKKLVAEVDDFLGDKSKKKLLSVFLNGYMGDIEQAFLQKLREAFVRIGVEKEFDQVLNASQDGAEIVEQWKQRYPAVYSRFIDCLKQKKIESKKFIAALKAGHIKAQKQFGELYQEITGGAAPRSTSESVLEVYKRANQLLAQKGYGGVFVVYDEFGKYLEQGVHNPSKLNVQFLQDFAEYCDRSGGQQCHLLLITHMSVSQYAIKLPVAIQKEWAKIEGRFQENSFYDKSANYYKLIERVFESSLKTDEPQLFRKVKEFFSESLEKLNSTKGLTGFVDEVTLDQLIACYPLHPVTLAYLPLLSQRVAQNERTLYTFLTRKEPHSLAEFLSIEHSESLPILMPSHLYDYFSSSIEKDTGVGGTHRIALIMEEALRTLENEQAVEKEILCLLALSEVLRNNRFAPCDEDFIIACLGGSYGDKDIKSALRNLLTRKLIVFNRVARRYELTQGSSIDIDEELEKLRSTKLSSKDMVSLMTQFLPQDYLVPNRYNLKNCITRFLRRELLSVEELKANKFDTLPNYEKEDGIVYVVVPFDQDELVDARRIVASLNHELVFFIVPDSFVECRKDIEELKAINALYNNKEIMSAGQLVRKELNRHHKQTLDSIMALLQSVVGNAELNIELFYPKLTKKMSVKSYPELLRRISEVLEEEFSLYPVFNSEHIVKQKPSSNVTIARRVLIDAIRSTPDAPMYNLDGDGPEKAIAKAMKQAFGELSWDKNKNRFLIPKGSPIRAVFEKYRECISSSADGISYKDIVARFMAPPFGIRKALLPLYLGVFDFAMEHQVNHYFAGEYVASPTGDHYELLAKNPRDGKIQMTELSERHRDYLQQFVGAFSDTAPATISGAVTAILNWRKSVPDYVKVAEAVDTATLKFIIAIDTAREPDRLLFMNIPAVFGFRQIDKGTTEKEILELISKVKASKKEASEAYHKLLLRLRSHLETMAEQINSSIFEKRIDINPKQNLAQSFQSLFQNLPEKAQSFKFKPETRQFVERVRTFDASMHKQYFIETLGDVATGKSPRAWDGRCESLFEFTLIRVQEEILDVCGVFKRGFVVSDGKEKTLYSMGANEKVSLNSKHVKVKAEIERKLAEFSIEEQRSLLLNLVEALN